MQQLLTIGEAEADVRILKYMTFGLNRKMNHTIWALLLTLLTLRESFLLFTSYSILFSVSFHAFCY